MQRNASSSTDRVQSWAPAVAVFVLVLACYWPALTGGMVWDDEAHVTRPDLRSLAGLRQIWTDVHSTQQFYPVLHSAFWVEHRLWGDATLGYHLVNVFLHAANCCLLALLLRRLWQAGPTASRVPCGTEWLAALLFAAHPVAVESVAWISEQKNTLSLAFYLLSALAYLNFSAERKRGWYALASGLFLLALGTKSVTASLPAALLVVGWWKQGTLAWRRDVLPLLPWFAAGLIAGLGTAWVEQRLMGADGAAYALTFAQRTLLAARAIWFYLGKLLWPAELMFIYPRWDVPALAASWAGYLVAALALTTGLWALRRRSRGPLAAWLLFVGALFPALGFFNVFPFVYSYVADHFQYLASLSLFAAAAAGLVWLVARLPARGRTGGWVLCGALVATLGARSMRQSRSYRDSATLYRDTLAQNPTCWMAHNNLAADLLKTPGHEAEAYEHYCQALRIKPDHAEAHNNLANLLAPIPGREAEAEAHYEAALRFRPDLAAAHNNLGNLLARLPGRTAEALAHYEAALRIRPGDPETHFNLAGQLAVLPGRTAEAMDHYQTAIHLKPDYVEAYNNLGALQAQQGHLAEAAASWRTALQIDPRYESARENLRLLPPPNAP